jgi:hypothetical protein
MVYSVLVSMIGIVLPVLAGIWLMPKSEAPLAINLSEHEPNQWLLLSFSRSREWLNSVVCQWHLPGSSVPASTGRHG